METGIRNTSVPLPSTTGPVNQSLRVRFSLENARRKTSDACKLIEGIQSNQAAKLIDVLLHNRDAASLADEMEQAAKLEELADRVIYEVKYCACQLDGYLEEVAKKRDQAESENAEKAGSANATEWKLAE